MSRNSRMLADNIWWIIYQIEKGHTTIDLKDLPNAIGDGPVMGMRDWIEVQMLSVIRALYPPIRFYWSDDIVLLVDWAGEEG